MHSAAPNNFSFISTIDPKVCAIQAQLDDDEAFWIADLNRPRESLSLWEDHLQTIKPFYAVKCCNEPFLLQFLADRGIGFDCASQQEISQILALGVDPNRIIFSHPIKSVSSLQYAKQNHIKRLVFDTIPELQKILRYNADAEVFLRVKPKFSNAVIQLSKKFGAEIADVPEILKTVKEIGANFIGFSFHVGSLCDDITTFRVALQTVQELKYKAEEFGLKVRFIDIGGGFLSPNAPANHPFALVAAAIEKAISDFFSDDNIEFIGEPGRFIASEYMDLWLPVICVKEYTGEKGISTQSIYIPDGMYGSFNALVYDHAMPHFEMFSKCITTKTIQTTLWGQTCDSADCIYDNIKWPRLTVGDLLIIRKFSAYTYSPTSFFNGFGHHRVFVVNAEEDAEY
jgi:ornithine decarboxylase